MNDEKPPAQSHQDSGLALAADHVPVLVTLRSALHIEVSNLRIMSVVADYDAYGGTGNIESINVIPRKSHFPAKLDLALRDFLWGLITSLCPGIEDDEGGLGTVHWDIVNNKIDIELRKRIIEYEDFSYKGL
jgi:hypothetical protein